MDISVTEWKHVDGFSHSLLQFFGTSGVFARTGVGARYNPLMW